MLSIEDEQMLRYAASHPEEVENAIRRVGRLIVRDGYVPDNTLCNRGRELAEPMVRALLHFVLESDEDDLRNVARYRAF